jgi:hypothetical protein
MSHVLPALLKEEEGLGAHTSVVLLYRTFGLVYFWCHSEFRPYGDKIALQCKRCYVVRKLTFRTLQKAWSYKVRCKQCKWELERTVDIKNGIPPNVSNGSVIGWGNRLLYGERSEVEAMRNAPREDYNNA